MALRVAFLVLMAGLVALGAASGEDCALPKCLLVDGHEVLCRNPGYWYEYRPHPTDCHKFFQCTVSGPVELTCPPGTAWWQGYWTCNHESAVPSCNA